MFTFHIWVCVVVSSSSWCTGDSKRQSFVMVQTLMCGKYFCESSSSSTCLQAWDKSILLNTCSPANVANKSSVQAKGTGPHRLTGLLSSCSRHTHSVNYISWEPTPLGQPNHFELLCWESFSPWAATRGSCISWVWYFTATWMTHQNRFSSGTALAAISDAYLNHFLYSTSETMAPLILCRFPCWLVYPPTITEPETLTHHVL